MERVFDIHNHTLWGVDDGSEDAQMSMRMMRIAADSGITDIILTPHNKPNRRNIYTSEIDEMIEMLRGMCKENGININLYPGNEIYYRTDVGERIELGKATTMACSHYVLLEYNPTDDWNYIKQGADDMLSMGYYPIIAHVERYVNVAKNIERAQELRNKGCYLQINAGSLMGDVGLSLKSTSKLLMKEGLVSFIASDAHEDRKRIPKLDKCVRYVEKKYGADTAEKIFVTNPMCILNDKYI